MASEESIYKLIPPEEKKQVKPPMYRSQFPGDLAPTASTFGGSAFKQIGSSNISGGLQHLKRGEHSQTVHLKTLPDPKKFSYPDVDSRKPAVPSREEKPIMGLMSTKNYIRSNAIAAILSEPKKLPAEPENYMKKPDYGKVPAYLEQVKRDIAEEYTLIQEVKAEEKQEPQMRLLTDEEKDQLLTALKAKWDKTNKEYQTMTHIVNLDTIGKIRRKEQYESELAQIEKDIDKLSKKTIYVSN